MKGNSWISTLKTPNAWEKQNDELSSEQQIFLFFPTFPCLMEKIILVNFIVL